MYYVIMHSKVDKKPFKFAFNSKKEIVTFKAYPEAVNKIKKWNDSLAKRDADYFFSIKQF